MMLLTFGGWFQCRLATDPDPSDEPRGVSGSMKALPGEPDLDRIIRLQPPFFQRSHTPTVGVFVQEVYKDGNRDERHALVGAEINLLEDPVFKGENGVVAEDGKEPIVPFIVQVKKGSLVLVRSCPASPEYIEFPYEGLQATGVVFAPGQVADATGIFDIRRHLDERVARLEEDKKNERDPTILDNLERRIRLLKSRNATGFFAATMPYFVPLSGDGSVDDPGNQLDREVDMGQAWTIDFWMGGWDPDASCGYLEGYLRVPEKTRQ